MRSLDPAIAARRAARIATHTEVLVWVVARNRSNGSPAPMGLWTGADHQTFTIGADTRTYYGAGAVLEVPDIEATSGLEVWTYDLRLSAIAPEAETLLRGYDVRFASVEIHRAEFDDAGNLIAAPERKFKGWVDGAPIFTPAVGGQASASLSIVSNARMLTRHGAGTKSDQQQKKRSNDPFRKFGSVAADVSVYWATEKVKAKDRVRDAVKGPRGI